MPNHPHPASRAPHTRRPDYVPTSKQEAFIVPLLRAEIEGFLDSALERSPLKRRALDVGCGRQPFRARIEGAGWHYEGLDVEQNPEGTVDHLQSLDHPLAPRLGEGPPFDLVLCTEVLEHVRDWHVAFDNLKHLTAPGGFCFVTIPFFYFLHEEPYDYWRPTHHVIRAFAEAVGFNVVSSKGAGDYLDILGTLTGRFEARARSKGPLAFAIRKTTALTLRGIHRLLRWGVLQRAITITGPLYLSNVVILGNPTAASAREQVAHRPRT